MIEAVIIVGAFLGAVVFCVAYPLSASPRRWTREGRHLWLVTASLGALAGVSILRRLIGEWPGYDLLVIAIYLAIALLMWQRVVLLVLARRDARDATRERLERP